MGLLKDNSVIHSASDADFTKYSYTQVYAGADTTATINGASVTMVGGSVLDIRVNSISGTDVYVIGNNKNTLKVDPNLGSISV